MNVLPDSTEKFTYLINNIEIVCKLFKMILQNLSIKDNHICNLNQNLNENNLKLNNYSSTCINLDNIFLKFEHAVEVNL